MAEGLKSFVAGGAGGICTVIVGHPLDTVKVRLQTTNLYKNMMDCIFKTLRNEGIKGFYRGVGAPLLSISPVYAVYFWGYDLGKTLIREIGGKSTDEELGIGELALAGGFSAIPGTIAMVPGDRIKVILQNQSQNEAQARFKGSFDCFRYLLRNFGVRGLYKGTSLTILRDAPGSVAYYGVYELLKRTLIVDEARASPIVILFSGGMAGVSCWIISIPPDVIKSRYQLISDSTENMKLKGIVQDLMEKGGLLSLYKGATPALLRAFFATAACFLGMETTRKFLDLYI